MQTETKAKHTPGPWRWFNYPDGRMLLTGENNAVIHCPDAPMSCAPEDQSLIAAAPELLAALKAMEETAMRLGLSRGEEGEEGSEEWANALLAHFAAINQARAAIAKAEQP